MKRFISFLLVAVLIFLPLCETFSYNIFALDDSSDVQKAPAEGFLAFPDSMKSSVITIGKDFFTDSSQEAEKTQKEIDSILDGFEGFGFNTVIIKTSYNGTVYYEPDEQLYPLGSPLGLLLDAAVSRHFFIYITFDVNTALRNSSYSDFGDKIDYLTYCVHRITSKYLIDGIILDNYYSEKNEESYSRYRSSGSGIGYERWLKENNSYLFSLVSEAIRATDNSCAVGIEIDNAWLNASSDELGSDTSDDFEALTDGGADTRGYILSGLADFMIVYCPGSISSKELGFNEISSWWNDIAKEAGIPMFIKHANQRISSSDRSWAVDQIVKQVIESEKLSNYRGSVFESYEHLVDNSVSTDALMKYYDGKIDVSGLYSNLKMVLPDKREFVTYEPTQIFQGTFDPNFPVYYNDEALKLNEAGNFYFLEDLDVGLNTFTFKNKADKVTYRITRKVQVLRSVLPENGTVMRVEGEARIAVDVIAYRGSKVKASLNGDTITLVEEEIRSDDLDANTYYTHFTGYFEAPEGIVGEEQDLGNITITGTYDEFSRESETSAHVIVNAIPETAEAAQLVRIKNDNTITYNYYTTDNIADPESPRLPAGTVDVYVNTVTYNTQSEGVTRSYDYYLTQSGLRIRADACELIDGYTFIDNTATFAGAYSSGGKTVINLNLGSQTPFTVSYDYLSYDNPSRGSYLVSSFKPEYVCITFDYLSGYSGTPTFSGDCLFTNAEWTTTTVKGEQKFMLRLRLRTPGVFMGYKSSYDGSGGLTLTFNDPRSLSGVTIAVDPGHGYNTSSSSIDPGAVGHVVEQEINLAIAKELTSQLNSAGANAYMLPSDREFISVYDRSKYALNHYHPDIYIAVHCNSVENGEGVKGVEAYYFTPFSQPLAAAVSRRMANYYENNVYGDGKSRDRGAKYNYFAVTLEQEFASILVECGFVTDYDEAMAMNNPTHQSGLAGAIVEAVREYVSR